MNTTTDPADLLNQPAWANQVLRVQLAVWKWRIFVFDGDSLATSLGAR